MIGIVFAGGAAPTEGLWRGEFRQLMRISLFLPFHPELIYSLMYEYYRAWDEHVNRSISEAEHLEIDFLILNSPWWEGHENQTN